MKALVITSLVWASLVPSGQAAAAGLSFGGPSDVRTGAFAGARFRLPLGPGGSRAKPRLGLTLAPMLRGQGSEGRVQMRFGEGVAFGFSGGERASLSVAGKPLRAFTQRQGSVDPKNASGVSTLGTVALVGAGVLVALGIAFVAFSEAMDCDEDEECN